MSFAEYNCSCGAVNDLSGQFAINRPLVSKVPEGACSVCYGCGRLWIADKDGVFREATSEQEHRMLSENSTARAAVYALRELRRKALERTKTR